MKIIGALLLSLVSLEVVTADYTSCVSACVTYILQLSEVTCGDHREKLPRPDMYNHCLEGNAEGRDAACAVACKGGLRQDRRLDTRRLDACDQFRGRPPSERMSACHDGFTMARTQAFEFVTSRQLASNDESVAEKVEPVKAPQQVVEPEKRKLSGNSPISPKSILEAAREEAANAFQDAKVSEL